jgi:hypothetical protein
MIKLTDILSENKIPLQSTDNKSNLPSAFPDFLVVPKQRQNAIIFIARKSVDLDKIEQLGDTSKDDITKQLAKWAEKKTKIKFRPLINTYQGAGYAIEVDIAYLANKL